MLKPEKKIQNQQFMRKYAHKFILRKQEISAHQNFGSFPPLCQSITLGQLNQFSSKIFNPRALHRNLIMS